MRFRMVFTMEYEADPGAYYDQTSPLTAEQCLALDIAGAEDDIEAFLQIGADEDTLVITGEVVTP